MDKQNGKSGEESRPNGSGMKEFRGWLEFLLQLLVVLKSLGLFG
jgi:hypothetical protein